VVVTGPTALTTTAGACRHEIGEHRVACAGEQPQLAIIAFPRRATLARGAPGEARDPD